ncbi:MAG TPA: glycosyltransferase family 4 protein [Steroidobacteraceae bacterium]|nr:glycosyltransferase family 4 protein [Steroidobacteraceae bacterium]
MKILAVTTRSPWPLHEGRALRTYNILREIARNHEVHLATFLQAQEEVDGLHEMRKFCAEVYGEPLYLDSPRRELLVDLAADVVDAAPILASKYRRAAMRAKIAEWLRTKNIDVLHLDMLHLGEYVPLAGRTPVVLVQHNVEAVIIQRRIETTKNALARAYLKYQHRKLETYEKRICESVDEVVTVSDLDSEQLRKLAPGGSYTAVPNGVDSNYFETKRIAKKPGALVYVGGLNWFPNLDAIRYFTAEILPRIQKRVPEVSLTVVGKLPSEAIAAEFKHLPNVRLTGTVDDVRPYIDEASAYVVPLRIGGGTRLKILDALSMSSALVSTAVGCEGLNVNPGEHLQVADEPQAFADAVVNVLSNPELARSLGAAGRARVCSHYDWPSIARRHEEVYARAIARN